ncbi:unnamed protein product [Rhizophagus irregularis]|nr:unnamed protein product [Rhizophagus irregularis]
MKGCKNMTYHFDCFDPEPSAPPQKGPSPQDPGPQKGPSPQDPGSQKDPAGSQGSNSQQPPKGNNVNLQIFFKGVWDPCKKEMGEK